MNIFLTKWTRFLSLAIVGAILALAIADRGLAQDAPATDAAPTTQVPATQAATEDDDDIEAAEDSSAESTAGSSEPSEDQLPTEDQPPPVEDQPPVDQQNDAPAVPVATGDDAAAAEPEGSPWYLALAVVLGTLILPMLLGGAIAKRVRMPETAWKINLVLITITAGSVIVLSSYDNIKLGPDLSGGINLVYELERTASDEDGADSDVMSKMMSAVRRRVDPGGVKEVTIREYGPNQIEIIIPKVGEDELEETMRLISTAGALEFRITANNQDHGRLIEAALKSPARTVKIDGQIAGRWVAIDPKKFDLDDPVIEQWYTLRTNAEGKKEILIVVDPFNVTGEYLSRTSAGIGNRGRPCVNFTFGGAGPRKFGGLTGANLPNTTTGFYRHLGIVLDDLLISAPTINSRITDRGQISGDFTQEEVDFLIEVLNAGSLPATLSKEPIRRQTMSPTLGKDMIQKGKQAIAISVCGVLVFMLLYYRFAGVIACLALAVNLVLILGVMISIKAAFTLPGLAGLVLTIGMAVDANVLIFERIREELNRGSALRMAIRNGFGRATTTIVDANLTTLITGVVLYVIGTDQIKGFAVTLILGIVISMYTAIFCSRIVFDMAERRRWIQTLSMFQAIGKTTIDFVGQRRIAAAVSIAVIAVGLAGVVSRGSNLLDIDFTGGSSVTIVLKKGEDIDIAEVRRMVNDEKGLEDAAVVEIEIEGDEHPQFNINARGSELIEIQDQLKNLFGEKLQTYSLEYEEPAGITSAEKAAASDEFAYQAQTLLRFGQKISHEALQERLRERLDDSELEEVVFALENPDHRLGSSHRYAVWELKIALEPQRTGELLQQVREQLESIPYFPSSSNIGGKVAGDAQTQAGLAMFVSLICIVGYIWIRFQRVMFGLAAVVALVHDVLITLGALALSFYLVQYAGPAATLLLIDPFKISLPIVAAFLVIIGYSLNDTIVVFDRIREVRGKSPNLTADMINTSINQTLSRTLLTSLTTLIVVVILYIFGGKGIHGFAFALVVGVMVGTYSSIFVASPVLLWMSQSGDRAAARKKSA